MAGYPRRRVERRWCRHRKPGGSLSMSTRVLLRDALNWTALRGADTVSATGDGKWILAVSTNVMASSLVDAMATRADGSKTVTWKHDFNGLGSTWLPDNRHLLHCTFVNGGISPYKHKPYAAGGIAILDTRTGKETDRVISGVSGYEQIVRVDKSGNLVMSSTSSDFFCTPKPGQVSVERVNINMAHPVLTVTQITVPNDSGAQDGNYFISPDGKRILWHFTVYDRTHGGTLILHERHGKTAKRNTVRRLLHLEHRRHRDSQTGPPDELFVLVADGMEPRQRSNRGQDGALHRSNRMLTNPRRGRSFTLNSANT